MTHTPKPTQKATLAQLRTIKAQIATCHKQEGDEPWLIVAKLRHQAGDLATAFVDPTHEKESE